MIDSVGLLVTLLAVATLAGLDLVSVVQSLLSRPVVVGTIAGWVLGDIGVGLRVGVVLEFFALDVVPVGSSRYPDFGAATVAAVLYSVGLPDGSGIGAAAAFGLGWALVAGATLPVTRRLNARVVRTYASRLAAGDSRAVVAVHWTCLGHDAVRSFVVAAFALGLALLLRELPPVPSDLANILNVIVLAGAGWAIAHGAVASARTGPRWRWAVAGLGAGAVVVAIR